MQRPDDCETQFSPRQEEEDKRRPTDCKVILKIIFEKKSGGTVQLQLNAICYNERRCIRREKRVK